MFTSLFVCSFIGREFYDIEEQGKDKRSTCFRISGFAKQRNDEMVRIVLSSLTIFIVSYFLSVIPVILTYATDASVLPVLRLLTAP